MIKMLNEKGEFLTFLGKPFRRLQLLAWEAETWAFLQMSFTVTDNISPHDRCGFTICIYFTIRPVALSGHITIIPWARVGDEVVK